MTRVEQVEGFAKLIDEHADLLAELYGRCSVARSPAGRYRFQSAPSLKPCRKNPAWGWGVGKRLLQFEDGSLRPIQTRSSPMAAPTAPNEMTWTPMRPFLA